MPNYPITVGGVAIKSPSEFQISYFNLTKSGRTANGSMKMEFIAKKAKLSLTYNVITGKELKKILDIINGLNMFFVVKYYDYDNVQRTITAYSGEMPMVLQRRGTIGDQSLWKKVQLDFIQQ